LNFEGGTFRNGDDDPVENRVAFANGEVELAAPPITAKERADLVDCVAETFADFNVYITTNEPAPNQPYMELVYSQDDRVIAPEEANIVTTEGCDEDGPVPNWGAVAFVRPFFEIDDKENLFTILACEATSQMVGASLGSDWVVDEGNVMSYLWSPDIIKTFKNDDTPCGEFDTRPCVCGGETFNQYEYLMGLLGPAR
jgi:hypothetical protein